MKAFFFGAGSSYGTLEGKPACPPLAKDFGDFLRKQSGFPEKYPNLAMAALHVGKHLSRIGLEELWTCIDYYAKLSGDANCALGDTPPWLGPAVHELKGQALLWLYGRRCDDAADALADSDGYTLGDLLKNQIKNGDVVASFNYDTVVERLARRFGLSLRHCRGAAQSFVKFAKPHGSASWPLWHLPSAVMDGEPLFDSLREDMNNDPLVLGAVPIKSELLREIQFHYGVCDVFKVIMQQWRGVVEAVRDADELVVIGYSFPKEDQYGRFLLQEAMRMRESPLRKIEYFNLNKESEDSMRELFGRVEIVWKGPVTAPGSQIAHC
jgi:hypothetical protein